MMPRVLICRLTVLLLLPVAATGPVVAVPVLSDEAGEDRPVVFLDKSPRIVEYQLRRLTNRRLLQVKRQTTDAKYIPVYEAILRRPGIARQQRDEAVAALATLQDSDGVAILLSALGELQAADRQQQQVARELTGMLLDQPLSNSVTALAQSAVAASPLVREAAFAALMAENRTAELAAAAATSDAAAESGLRAVRLLPSAALRNRQRDRIVTTLQEATTDSLRAAALEALSVTTVSAAESVRLAASVLDVDVLRPAAVRALLELAGPDADPETCRKVLMSVVERAESISAEERTSAEFVDEMQLADALLGRLPAAEATALRERLRAVTVRIVRIRTVLEEMRYDTPYFAAEAGRPVQVILQNEDLMPHNLVLTRPGQLQLVAEQGVRAGPDGVNGGLPYVPESSDVLFATSLVGAGRSAQLTFDAPDQPGDYPYVCTFPRHWMRMYGVMRVVPDLDAWLQNPVPPEDPLGNTRPFVRNWTLADLADGVDSHHSQDRDAGRLLFREATCALCHRIDGSGGVDGPDLTEVLTRWKGDRRAVLREILEPSYRIEPKYAVQLVITTQGRTISGIVKEDREDSVVLLQNPEADEPVTIPREDIEEIVPSTTSMMPRALLDKFTREEILEILHYICREPQATAVEEP